MTEDEIKEADNVISQLNSNRYMVQDIFDDWDEIVEYYSNEQPEVKNVPNSKINRFHANIEGQVTALVEQNLAITCKGQGPSDRGFANWAQIGLDWTLRKNNIKTKLTIHERRRELFGNGVFGLSFDPKAINGFGLVTINPTPLNKLYVDIKIKDPLRFQEAEYIAETITMSKQQFIDRYGEEKAEMVEYGKYVDFRDGGIFTELQNVDDENSSVLILYWSRQDGKLRLREYSACGVLLYDCHKKGGRKDNQKKSEEEIKSYYNYVNDKYPYFYTIMYPVEGRLQGFGNGKLLLPLQKLLNELYDKIRIASRPNIVLYDPDIIQSDLSDFDENSLNPRPADLTSGNGTPIISVPWMQVQPDWWALLKQIEEEIQHVSRFSSLMLGMSGKRGDQTATESAIQQQQGHNAIDHQKILLQETLVELCQYALGLMMDNYTSGKAFRLDENKEDYEWIDFRDMTKVPVMKPVTSAYEEQYTKARPGAKKPKFEPAMGRDGKPLTKSVDLDIEINIGAGLPKNKAFLYQMMAQLAPVQIGGKPLVEWSEMRALMKDWLGLPLNDDQEAQLKMMVQQYQQQPQQSQPPSNPLVNANNPSGGLIQQQGMVGG